MIQTITAFTQFDTFDQATLTTEPVSVSASELVYTSGAATYVLTGNFAVSEGSVTGGEVTGISYSISGETQFVITGTYFLLDYLISSAESDSAESFTGTIFHSGTDFFGSEFDDTVHGQYLDDLIFGYGGNDTLYGGEDIDRLVGGQGSDMLYGEDGNDMLEGGNGRDIIHGGLGADSIKGENGNDRLFGNGGSDTIRGGIGKDTLKGNNGHDDLYGEAGNDVLKGGTGRDYLGGGTGDDTLIGGAGQDTLNGGAGYDILTGGAGRDTFVFETGSLFATITDFNVGQDMFDVSAFGVTNKAQALAHMSENEFAVEFNFTSEDFGAATDVVIYGVTLAELSDVNFIFVS